MSAFIDQERERFAVELICRTLGVSQSAYYERRGSQRSARAVQDERLLARIEELHEANYSAPTATGGCGRRWAGPARTSGVIASGA